MGNPVAEKLSEMYDEGLLQADGYDDCILGVTNDMNGPRRLVYSVSKILVKLEAEMADDEDPYSSAREHFDYNMAGGYVGPQTPVWVEDEEL